MAELAPAEVEATLAEFAQKIERLRVSYDQYFMGIAKREPSVQLKDVVRIMYLLDQQKIRNSRQRFRYRTAVQKLNTLRTQWNRTLRQMEAGTYFRDVARMRRKMESRGVSMPSVGQMRSAGAVERAVRETATAPPPEVRGTPMETLKERAAQGSATGPAPETKQDRTETAIPAIPVDGSSGAATQTNLRQVQQVKRSGDASRADPATQRSFSQQPGPNKPGNRSGISQSEAESVYRRFVKAKKMCGEDTSSVRYETLVDTINRQLPKIRAKNPGKDVEFQVVIRSGRAILKAAAKKSK